MLTPVALGLALAGTKLLGPERTARYFETVGRVHRRTPLRGRVLTPARIAARVERSYRFLPLPVECLEQALVTWYQLNVKGHAAVLKIGMKITPLQGHAWVQVGDEVCGAIPGLEDFTVVSEFPPWPS